MRKRIFSVGLLLILFILILNADGKKIQTFKQSQNMDGQKSEAVEEEQLSEQIQNTDEQKGEAIKKAQFLKKIQSIDYTVREYPINRNIYDEKMYRTYRKAFYEALTGQIPWEYGEKEDTYHSYRGAVYFRDSIRGLQGVSDEEFASAIAGGYDFYYLDFDKDGLPELAMDTRIDGIVVLTYVPEEECVKCIAWPYYARTMVGSGQTYETHSGSISYTSYYYKDWESGETVKFSIYYPYDADGENEYTIEYSQEELNKTKVVQVTEEEWEKASEDYFAATKQPLEAVEGRELFGEFGYPSVSMEKEEEVRKRYQEFLAGGETAEGITLVSLSQGNMQYAVWEVDGDGLPELHIRTGERYFIFKVDKEQVFLWKVFEQDEEEKYVLLRNGQILGKIRHTTEGEEEESYYLYQLGISGTEELVFAASYRDENGDGSPDQEDSYEIRENGWKDREWTGCEEKLWLEKTRAFLYTDGEGIQQIRGEVGWLDLRVDPAVNNENTSAMGNGNEEPEESGYIRSYDLIRQGDWSEVEKPEEMAVVWEDLAKDPEDYDWTRVDLNGDGIPELVAEEWEKDPLKKEIYFIFTWKNGRVKLAYWDDMSAMSFLFRGGDDRLIYEDSSSYMGGQPNYYLCEFDGEWNLVYTEALSLFYFMDDQMSEAEKEAFRNSYPLTYGTGGKGVYFLLKRPKDQSGRTVDLSETEWAGEVITPEEFFDRYREMTGHGFFQVEEDYSPFNQIVESALVMGKEGYLILGGRQLELLAEMIRQGQEIEPGLPAAEATYYLYRDVEVKDWLYLGSSEHPFSGKFYGNGYTISGFGFSIVVDEEKGEYEEFVIDLKEDRGRDAEFYRVSREKAEEVFGEPGKAALAEALQEGETLEGVFLQRLNGLDVCIFYTEERMYMEFHLLYQGSYWEGKSGEIPFRHLTLKSSSSPEPIVTVGDVNGDGLEDLLIYGGFYGGTSRGILGATSIYYALVWNEQLGDFQEYPSFPQSLDSVDLQEKKLVSAWHAGVDLSAVEVYGLVNGEYEVVRRLEIVTALETWTNESGWEQRGYRETILYYEGGELVFSYKVPENKGGYETAAELFPDLDYWPKG